MSGTSVDGIDAVAVHFGAKRATLVASRFQPYPATLRRRLLALINDETATAALDELAALDVILGERFASVTLALLKNAGIERAAVGAIGSHGQTVRHRPDRRPASTLQIGDPNIIAARTGITTVADFRRRDMALGGEGAPLVPGLHAALFSTENQARAVLNIGGIANLTLLPARAGRVTGFDTGPGNVLLDAWIGLQRGLRYDRGGAWATSGRMHVALLADLLTEPYFSRQPPKSTGRELFNLRWLQTHLGPEKAWTNLAAADVQATLLQLTAVSVAQALHRHAPRTQGLWVCGGGAHNRALMRALAERLPDIPVETTAALGLEPDWVEAVAFAWLARQTLRREPGSLASVTGARRDSVLGGVYYP